MKREHLEKYAKALVHIGVNLQRDQLLVVQATVDLAPLAVEVCREAFATGARDVIVHYKDQDITYLRAANCDVETLRRVEDWEKESLRLYFEQGAALIALNTVYPQMMDDLPDERVIAVNFAKNALRNVVRHYIHKGTTAWVGTMVPNVHWAKTVYPELPEEEALRMLEGNVLAAMRISDDTDPVEQWHKHCEELSKVSSWLNSLELKSLHITSELGTDITLDLVEGHIWTSAGDMGSSASPVPYVANMPTEEIFTDPHKYTANGTAYGSRPLLINGKLVRGFSITFKDGKAVDCHADENETLLRAQLFRDERSCYLGEVALVSKHSPLAKMDKVFCCGLLDENSVSHMAFGQSFSTNVKGGTDMTDEELEAIGVNVANNHNDFMIGTPEFHVVGTTKSGETVVIMDHGEFTLEAGK